MQPFTQMQNDVKAQGRDAFVKINMRVHGLTKRQAVHVYREMKREEIYVNDLYQVNLDRRPVHNFGDDVRLVHLSIKLRTKEVIHDWRHLQEIKNLLCGPECEAIELYPAESRRVDSANQYHLWVFADVAFSVPCGWQERLVTGTITGTGKQRPLED